MADLFLTEDAQRLLNNKFVVVIGDSVQRAVYKDLVLLLQENRYLRDAEQRRKGERTFCNDSLVAGGILSKMTNEPVYREVREYRTTFHLVKFFFVTRCYDDNVKNILNTLSSGEDGDVDFLIMNSAMWDVTRYGTKGVTQYGSMLKELCEKFEEKLPNTLILWTTTLPVAEKVKGGFLVPEVEFLQDTLRLDIMLANATVTKVFLEAGFDVLDTHYFMRRQLHRRCADGIHWDYTAHRRITNMLLTHLSQAWDEPLPERMDSMLTEKFGKKHTKEDEDDDGKPGEKCEAAGSSQGAASSTPMQQRRKARARRRITNESVAPYVPGTNQWGYTSFTEEDEFPPSDMWNSAPPNNFQSSAPSNNFQCNHQGDIGAQAEQVEFHNYRQFGTYTPEYGFNYGTNSGQRPWYHH